MCGLDRVLVEAGFRPVMHLTASHCTMNTLTRCVPKQDTLLSIVSSDRKRT